MKDTWKIETTTTTVRRIELTGDDIVELLASRDAAFADYKNLVRRIWIQIPGGADWSNMQLDITAKTPVIITIERTTTEKNNG